MKIQSGDSSNCKRITPQLLTSLPNEGSPQWNPDLGDPQTLDCLKATIREVTGDESWDVCELLEGGEVV